MVELKIGQVWELYSWEQNAWVPATVTEIDDGNVTFHYKETDELHRTTEYKIQCYPGLYRPRY